MTAPHALVLRTAPSALVAGGGDAPVELVAAFFAGRNPRTLRAYRQDLADFAAFLGTPDVRVAADTLLGGGHGAANARVIAYRAALVDRGLSPATINRRLAAVRSLVKLARTMGLVPWSLEVDSVATMRYRDTRGPGAAGVARLLAVLADRDDDKAVRDRAILALLYDMALRRGEVVALDAEHVDLAAGTLSILGKGRKERETLTIPEPTHRRLAAWLERRGDAPGPLFRNMDPAGKGKDGDRDGRLTGTSLYRIVRDLGQAAGVRARPHGLRHAAITDALDATNGNVRAVQQFSRHRDVRVLTRYDDNREDLGGVIARQVASRLALHTPHPSTPPAPSTP